MSKLVNINVLKEIIDLIYGERSIKSFETIVYSMNNDKKVNMDEKYLLKSFEEFVLLAFPRNKSEYGWNILKKLRITLQKDVSFGSLYPTLNKLESLGFLNSEFQKNEEIKEKESKQRGIPKKYYKITEEGLKALNYMEVFRVQVQMENIKFTEKKENDNKTLPTT
jgi:PadR family transcriptional regulator, regulatory protein PadR